MNLLLLSNSTNSGDEFLGYAMDYINRFLGDNIKNVLFIPFAAVTISYDQYSLLVKEKFSKYGYNLNSIHNYKNYKKAILSSDAIVVGGGNTFKLLNELKCKKLLNIIRNQVLKCNVPYIGWSAGANLACPTIMTTNDMPVVKISSFKALNFIPFQINPHYNELKPKDFGGESRIQRLIEFIEMNPKVYVVGLYEGSAILVNCKAICLLGDKKVKIFIKGKDPQNCEVLPENLIKLTT